jgi:hypothetical protein
MTTRRNRLMGLCVVLGGLAVLPCGAVAQDVPADYQDVLKSLDRKGDFKAGVLKVNIPRTDLKITVQGFPAPTPFGFGGWISLSKTSDGADVMMGDLESGRRAARYRQTRKDYRPRRRTKWRSLQNHRGPR